jgi:hypothetical protein
VTKSVEFVMREIAREVAGELRVCMPARIDSYDANEQTASVQPLLRRKFYGQADDVLLPIINRVPVIHPRTASALIRLPVARGDIVTLVFADRSLESWLSGDGGDIYPADTRQHHLTDAYAILGGYPRGQAVAAQHPNALEIVVASGTKVTIGNGTDELLQIADDAFSELKSLVQQVSALLTQAALITVTGVQTGSGVSGVPVNAALFVTIKAAVDGIGTTVDATRAKLANIKV